MLGSIKSQRLPYRSLKTATVPHFSLCAMMAAPLIAGNDFRKMSKKFLDIFTNKEVIAVDQDALGIQGYAMPLGDSLQVWIKPLLNNDVAVCFLNRAQKPQMVNYDWEKNPVVDSVMIGREKYFGIIKIEVAVNFRY